MNYRVILRRMWMSVDLDAFEVAIGSSIEGNPEAIEAWRDHTARVVGDRPKQEAAERELAAQEERDRFAAEERRALAEREAAERRRPHFDSRICEGCAKRYTPSGGSQRFCTPDCREKARLLDVIEVIEMSLAVDVIPLEEFDGEEIRQHGVLIA